MSFQVKLELFFIALFLSIQALTFVAVYTATRNYFKTHSEELLVESKRNIKYWVKNQESDLIDKAFALISEVDFRRALLANRKETLDQYIFSSQSIAASDRVVVVSERQKIIYESSEGGRNGVSQTVMEPQYIFDLLFLLKNNKERGTAGGFVIDRGQLVQMVFLPLELQGVLIWVGIGRAVAGDDLRSIRDQTQLPVEIALAAGAADGSWLISAATVDQSDSTQFLDLLKIWGNDTHADTAVSRPHGLGGKMVGEVQKFYELANGRAVVGATYFSLSRALAIYQPLFSFMVVLAVIGLVLTIFGCFYIARSITTSLRAVDLAVARITAGDYTAPVIVHGNDEISRLGNAMNSMMENIRVRAEQSAHQLLHDVATGLPNRKYLEIFLGQLIDDRRRFSVMVTNIAHFSDINNTLGHEIGDEVITEFSERLQSVTKKSDFKARLTGKSFVVVLLSADETVIDKIVTRVLRSMDVRFTAGAVDIGVTVYMGLAIYPDHGDDSRSMLRKAETALDEARRSPLRYAIYDRRYDPYKPELLALMREFRLGLRQGEFILHYQPKLEIKSRRIVGCEALVRWNHPKKGLVLPGDFIPMAERTGNINHLTLWALDAAMAQSARWRSQGVELSMAVNLSVKDLQYSGFIDQVTGLVKSHGVSPTHIFLEVTETEEMSRPGSSLNTLNALHDMGFPLSIDDYGAGYSSMSYIRRLPIGEVKIDRMFISDIATSEEDQIIVASTIKMAHSLGLKVTAEGVEDERTLALLADMQCNCIQGYYFSRPLPEAEFMDFFMAHQGVGATSLT